MASWSTALPHFRVRGGRTMHELRRSILDGDAAQCSALAEEAAAAGVPPEKLLAILIDAMNQVGEEYERGERFVPEMLVAADAMKAAMSSLRPRLQSAGIRMRGRVVLGTVDGDLHDIGKNLVGMMLEGAGFEVIDLGVEVSSERFVEAVREHHPDIIALSALLTTTMVHMPEVIEALRVADLRDCVRVMVGGAPVTQEYAQRIGADGYAPDAPSAVALANRLIGE
jgi:5-methyltetrahydrofolate--homocysteine methyltransferase